MACLEAQAKPNPSQAMDRFQAGHRAGWGMHGESKELETAPPNPPRCSASTSNKAYSSQAIHRSRRCQAISCRCVSSQRVVSTSTVVGGIKVGAVKLGLAEPFVDLVMDMA
jgi:hypothetical protein